MYQSLEGKGIPAGKLLSALEGQVTRVELQSKSVGLQCLKFVLRDVEGARHDVDAVIGDSQFLVAVIFDGVLVVQVDHIVIGLIEGEFLNVLATDVSWQQGRIDSGSFAILAAALIGIRSASSHSDIAFSADAVSFEEGASRGLVLAHFVPFTQIVI